MKITAVQTPLPQQVVGQSQSQQAARERAISKLTASASPQPEQQVVQNQSQVSAEEMGAIAPRKAQEEETTEEVGQSDSIEATSPAQEPERAAEEKPSPQLLALARRERALRAKAQQQEQAFKAREAALAAKEAELSAKGNQYNEGYITKDKLKSNPLLALQEAGLSYDDVVQAALNQQSMDPRVEATISKLEAKIRSLEEANETSSKNMTAQQQAQYDAAVKQIRTDAKKLVYTDPNLETVKATNSVSDVVELIEETYKKDGILLSVEEAAQMVEDYLVEEALKLTKISKIKNKLSQPAQAGKAQVQQRQPPKQPQPMKTLTNANSSGRQLSAKERAILAFRGELKS
jgi:hypothetical protein